MFKIYKYLYFIIVIILFIGCNNGTNKYLSTDIIVINDPEDKKIGDLLTYSINHKIVCLETIDESLITDITDIKNINNKIYIFDKRQKSIMLDKKSDYETVSFLTDSTFCVTSKGSYKKYVGNDCMIHTFDHNGSLKCSELSFCDAYNELIQKESFKLNIYRKNNELHINIPFENKIFVKSKDSVFCKTEIIFDGMDNIELLYGDLENVNKNGVVHSMKNTNIVTLGTSFIDKDSYILTSIYNSDPTIKYLLYNKETELSTYYNFNLSRNDVLMIGGPIIYNGDKNKLNSIINPSEIKKLLNSNIVCENKIQ